MAIYFSASCGAVSAACSILAASSSHIQGVIDQVVAEIEFLFLFTLVSGALVLYAALVGSQDERPREAVLLRALAHYVFDFTRTFSPLVWPTVSTA